MSKGRITKRIVDALEPKDRDYVKWDEELKGFGVRVRKSGSMSFVAVYRTSGRRSPLRRVTIGAVGKVEADKARDAAQKILAGAKLGRDLAGERASQRAELTISELCQLYLEEGCNTKKPSTMATDKGRIERHIKPLLGKKRVGEVTRADVEKFMRDVAAGKTAADVKTRKRGRAIVEGGKGTATRTVGLLGGIFSFAVTRRMRADNPVRGVKRYPDGKGKTFLSPKQFMALGNALAAAKQEARNSAALAIIRLLAVTGARRGEIAGLKWSEVDLAQRWLRLGDSKTGAKVVPLGVVAAKFLAGLPRIEGSPFVFPAAKGKSHYQGVAKVWHDVRTAAGFPQLRLHDLRHSFASAGLAGGHALPVIGAILGHADAHTTEQYAHLADDPVRSAANEIAKTVSGALDGKRSGNVIKLKPRGRGQLGTRPQKAA